MPSFFAKVDAGLHRHPKVRRAGRNGREVFVFLLCTNADRGSTGVVPAAYAEPWFLADALQITEAEALEGLERAVAAGLVARTPDGSVSFGGWDDEEWGRGSGSMTERERKSIQRLKRRNATDTTEEDDVSGQCPDSVRTCSADVRTSGLGEERRGEEKRGEEIERTATPFRLDLVGDPVRQAAAKRSTPKATSKLSLPPAWMPSQTHAAKATKSGLDLEAEAEKFKHHHLARDTRFASWDHAFHTWLSNAVEFRRNGTPGRATSTEPRQIKTLG